MTKWRWAVWSDSTIKHYLSFIDAERAARRMVLPEECPRVEILFDAQKAATVRLDGCERIWTDLSDDVTLPREAREEIARATSVPPDTTPVPLPAAGVAQEPQ